MNDDRLYHDPDLADFYDLENGWERSPDFAFCQALAADAASVLDLGCGTGELAVALAGGRTVVGVDPAPAMLAIARAKPSAENATFIEGDARTLRLGRRFDLVLLTGHAFQVFLTVDDRRAALATIAAHLAPGGRFVFDSRNPACREWEEWGPQASLRPVEHPRFGTVAAWNDATHDPARHRHLRHPLRNPRHRPTPHRLLPHRLSAEGGAGGLDRRGRAACGPVDGGLGGERVAGGGAGDDSGGRAGLKAGLPLRRRSAATSRFPSVRIQPDSQYSCRNSCFLPF